MKIGSWVRRTGAAAVVAALGLTVVGPFGSTAATGTTVTPLTGRVGMASHTFWLGESDVRAQMTQLAANGVTWVREDFLWDVLEPTKGSFNWSRSDALMAGAAAAGVQVLAILDYSAKWASSDPSGAGNVYFPPKNNADYAAYARAVVTRYGAGGTFWALRPDLPNRPLTAVELWNEPWGHWFWKSGVDPAAYARLARAGAEAVNAVQPGMKVLLSGDLLQVRTDGALVEWLDKVLAADPGLVDLVDAYSIHPYPYPRQQGPLVDHADRRWDYSRVALIRDVTVRRNAEKPFWITEIGWSTANTSDSVTEANQATFLRDAINRAFSEWPYVERFFTYTWTQDRADMNDREAHYGVRRADGTWKPSWAALVNLIAASVPTSSTTAAPTTSTAAPTTTSTTAAPTTTSTTAAPTTTTAAPTTTSTAPPLLGITLSVRTSKVSGAPRVELTWGGVIGTLVGVTRDGATLATTTNDGSHVDQMAKGTKGTFRYVVCDALGLICSPTVSVVVR